MQNPEKEKRIFAIYLPQFHPFPENDMFWGKGFTEWHNVTSATPLFSNHKQPHLPTELGFYDLRVAEVMKEQSLLASNYAIDGFIFYHYWFNGKVLMDKPLENYLHLKENKLPYYFCWANENWTRRWDGKEAEVLLKQEYKKSDNDDHFKFLANYFRDDKYLKINNRPVLALYRPSHVPDIKEWVNDMRALAIENGFEGIYLIYVIHLEIDKNMPIADCGFDAGLLFQPSWKGKNSGQVDASLPDKFGKLFHKLKLKPQAPLVYRHSLIDYPKHVTETLEHPDTLPIKTYPSVCPMWDNSARRKKGGGTIFINSTPEEFKRWLDGCYSKFQPFSKEENFIVINAWNEWAEGNYLEPSNHWGREYLKAVKEVVEKYNK